MMESERYYVAYGSNLNKEQMNERCPDSPQVTGTAKIMDYRLVYRKSKTGFYLTIEEARGSYVPVGIWKVSDKDEKELDVREGCPKLYKKKDITLDVVLCDDSAKTLNCFIYILGPEHEYGLPKQKYVDRCRIGYKEFGFDEAILDKAWKDTEKEEKH